MLIYQDKALEIRTQMNSYVSDHKRIEERSLALHKEIANRIRKDPHLLAIPRANLKRFQELFSKEGRRLPSWLMEWKSILEKMTPDDLAAFLVSPDEKAARLRQSSPFSGILTPGERWEIYEAFSTGAYYKGGLQHHRGS